MDEKLERAIVLELLDDVGGYSHSCAELASLIGASDAEIEQAVRRLCEAGVLDRAGREIRASPAVMRLDALGLIGI